MSEENGELIQAGYEALEPLPEGVAGAPNEKKLVELMKATGYFITQTNGQRKFGPPPDWQDDPPPRGCEVFIGKIPRDLYEDELVPVLQTVGKLYELRLMMDFSGTNRGYAFAVYTRREDAKQCVRSLNNYEIRKGRTIGVCQSVDNCRLFVGGLPRKATKEEILAEMTTMTEGVRDVIVYAAAADKTKNRGFAFVEYNSHRAAAMARRKLMTQGLDLWGHHIAVDWAEPEAEVDEEIMAKVKVLYVRNLMLSTTEEHIHAAFSHFAPVEKVKKIRDYAFVHFMSRDDAERALEAMNESELDGSEIAVSWAKPVDREQHRMTRVINKQMTSPFTPFHDYSAVTAAVYSQQFSANRYGEGQQFSANRYGEGQQFSANRYGEGQQFSANRYGEGQQFSANRYGEGQQFSANRYGEGQQFSANRYGERSHLGSRGRCKVVAHATPRSLVPSVGGAMVLTPAPAMIVRQPLPFFQDMSVSNSKRNQPTEILEEFCNRNSWGSPAFTLLSTDSNGVKLYLWKVMIHGLGQHFQSTRLSQNTEDAKQHAAEYALSQLGFRPYLEDSYSARVGFGAREATPSPFPGFVSVAASPSTHTAPPSPTKLWPHDAAIYTPVYDSLQAQQYTPTQDVFAASLY